MDNAREQEPLLPMSVSAKEDPGDAESHKPSRSTGAQGVLVAALSPYLGITSAVLYGSVAIAMNFVNKFTMQIYPLANVVMVGQMAAIWAILHSLLITGHLDFPPFAWAKARQLFWITAMYTLNTVTALIGLRTLNVPMYNVLKRLTPILVLGVKAVLKRRLPPLQISASVCVMVLSCVIAGIGDLTFDLQGYVFALSSCLAQAAYLLLVEYQGQGGVSSSEMLYYNAITSLPLLAAITLITGEAAAMMPSYYRAVAEHGPLLFWSTVTSCSLMGILLNYSLFLCTTNNSALTTTVVGVIKSVFAVLLGFFLLGGVPFNLVNVVGISLNMVGGIWYTAYKFNEKGARKAAAQQQQQEERARHVQKNEGAEGAALLIGVQQQQEGGPKGMGVSNGHATVNGNALRHNGHVPGQVLNS